MEYKKRVKRKKGKKSLNYFDRDTEEAIVQFQQERDIEKRKDLFLSRIRPAFIKLIENIIFVYKFHALGNVDVLKSDCLTFLFESIEKFDATKGHKAFSYFSVMSKNWYIQKVKSYKKISKSDVALDKDTISALEKNNNDMVVISYEDLILKKEFFSLLKDEVCRWHDKFEKDQEKKILDAIILLLNNPGLVTIYNKKGIFLYLREITGFNTKQIVTNLQKFKKKYNLFKTKYHAGEV